MLIIITGLACSGSSAYKVLMGREKAKRKALQREYGHVSAVYEEKKALLHACSSFAFAKSLLHLLLHMLHLLGPLLTQTLLVISDDGGVAHEGDEANAE